jgi:hypothetical protein
MISQCYATGKLSKRQQSGGFAGHVDSQVEIDHAYWDVTTSLEQHGIGSGDVQGIVGLTDAQLKSALPDGFDAAVWGQNPKINSGYPYLLANPPQ